MTRQDFKNIRNLQELEQARQAIEKSLAESQNTLNKDLYRVQHMFSPLSLADAGLHAVAPNTPSLRTLLLRGVRSLKKRL